MFEDSLSSFLVCKSGNQQRTALGWSQVELIDQQALNRAMFPSFSRQLTGTLDLF